MREIKIDKKIRLIEAFGGIGTQAMALRDIGADFEHYRLIEFDAAAVKSYNAIHGTDFEPTDIRDVHGTDLNIVNKRRYTYILTYSFPCTSLSLAGKRQGMRKGSNTQSSLLWEIERILSELPKSQLPDILLMENVTQVHKGINNKHFTKFCKFLASLGYKNFGADLNAKDYGVPQSRDRCFMISLLEKNVSYEFPKPIKQTKVMNDLLEKNVDDEFFVDTKPARDMIKKMKKNGTLGSTAKNFNKVISVGFMEKGTGRHMSNTVYDRYAISPTIMAAETKVPTKIVDKLDGKWLPRKLTMKEAWRMMGFSDNDYRKAARVVSRTHLRHQAGNAIVKQVLMAIFRQMHIKGVKAWNKR